jgi:transcriptional regulator with XRE-family HTH domain
LSKAEVARTIGAEPATVRRIFSSTNANPTLGTLAEVAAALGLRISIEPLPAEDHDAVTEPLRTGKPSKCTAERLRQMRQKGRNLAA